MQDCLSYFASAETVRDLLLPSKTTVYKKWLPAENVLVIVLSAEAQQEADSHRLSKKPLIIYSCLSRKQAFSDSLRALKKWRTSLDTVFKLDWCMNISIFFCYLYKLGQLYDFLFTFLDNQSCQNWVDPQRIKFAATAANFSFEDCPIEKGSYDKIASAAFPLPIHLILSLNQNKSITHTW